MERIGAWKKLLVGGSLALIGLELISAFVIEVPVMAVVYAVLLAAGVMWMTKSGSRGSAIYLGVLHLIELLLVSSFVSEPASETGGWALLGPVIVASIAGVAGALGSLRTRTEPKPIQ